MDVGALYRTGYARVDSGLGDWDDEHVCVSVSSSIKWVVASLMSKYLILRTGPGT